MGNVMKKLLTTALALIYLTSSMGATVHLHFCMGKLIGWGLVDSDTKNCSYCGMQKITKPANCTVAKEDCCRDEQKQLSTDKDQRQALASFKFSKLLSDQFLLNPGGNAPVFHLIPSIDFPNNNAPPEAEKIAIFLRNCNFRI
jgi:hypothetical protein